MRPKKTSIIESAPSVADIVSSAHRVGAVDFGASLSARLEAPPAAVRPDHDDPPVAAEQPEPAAPAAPPAPLDGLDEPDGLDDRTRQAAKGTGEMLELLVELMTKDLPRPGTGEVGADPTVGRAPQPSRVDRVDEVDGRAAAEVAEVAASVIASMRRVREAHERHVVALELETARRCELLTSQADLDAELIRLHARREAHAIVFAARARSGDARAHDDTDAQGDQLDAIGETLSRFAETVDTLDADDSGDLFTEVLPADRSDRSDRLGLFDHDRRHTDDVVDVDRTLARRRLDIPRDS